MTILGSPQPGGLEAHYNGDWRALLDTPALVHAIHAHTGVAYQDSDHWVASVKVEDTRTGLYDFVYQARKRHSDSPALGQSLPLKIPMRIRHFPIPRQKLRWRSSRRHATWSRSLVPRQS